LRRGGYGAFGELSTGVKPNIVLHDDCRPRICGNEIVCDNCPCFFNCYTGNVDDGKVEKSQTQIDNEKKDKEREMTLFKKQRQDDIIEKKKKELEILLKKYDVTCYLANNSWYIKIKSAIFKLSELDLIAIENKEYNTDKTNKMREALINNKISPDILNYVLSAAKIIRGVSSENK
jgi:hypothetical protein